MILLCDKSLNGKAARTMSPIWGMSAEIGIHMAGLNVSVGIKFRLRFQKIESSTSLALPAFCFSLVQKRAQGRSRPPVSDNSLPSRVAIQLGKKSGQFASQFFPFARGKLLNGGLDFLNGAHGTTLGRLRLSGKPDVPDVPSTSATS
jgi:hypothetical protein